MKFDPELFKKALELLKSNPEEFQKILTDLKNNPQEWEKLIEYLKDNKLGELLKDPIVKKYLNDLGISIEKYEDKNFSEEEVEMFLNSLFGIELGAFYTICTTLPVLWKGVYLACFSSFVLGALIMFGHLSGISMLPGLEAWCFSESFTIFCTEYGLVDHNSVAVFFIKTLLTTAYILKFGEKTKFNKGKEKTKVEEEIDEADAYEWEDEEVGL